MAGYILKITMENTHPPVWRRIVVPERITFLELHEIIQIIFGWEDEHLHEFSIPSKYIRIGSEEIEKGCFQEEDTLIESFLLDNKWIRYIYDFGDEWRHKIIYERTDENYDKRCASLLKFKGDNFLEDSGGIWEADETQWNRKEFNREETESLLEKYECPPHMELTISKSFDEKLEALLNNFAVRLKGELEAFSKKNHTMDSESDMSKKINRWKRFIEQDKGKIASETELVPANKTNSELLKDLGMKEAADYCKYLQIPSRTLWEKEKLTEAIAHTFREHPKYLLYVLYEKEYRELRKWMKAPGDMKKGIAENTNTWIKLLCLGLADVSFGQDSEKDCVQVSFASDIEEILHTLNADVCRQVYRKLNLFSKRLENLILFYGVLEISSLYEMLCSMYHETMEKEEFNRCLYWHARFNNLLQTAYFMDGRSYAASIQLDLQGVLEKTGDYAEELDYAVYPVKELEKKAKDVSKRSVWLDILFTVLHYQMHYTEEKSGAIIEEMFAEIMNGEILPDVLNCAEPSKGADQSLQNICDLWTCTCGMMLELELPMLKGRSRIEYAQIKKMSPWKVGMLKEESVGINSKEQHIYEFPADIQEAMFTAVEYVSRDMMQYLWDYKRNEKIQSEEFIYLLAEAYATACEFKKAGKLVRELEKSSERGRRAAGVLWQRIENGQDVMDDDGFTDDEAGFYPWSMGEEPECRQQPYVRETRKIGRNEPCPCGSGKKYKNCCGKGTTVI